MKLYVIKKGGGKKIFLRGVAPTKKALARNVGGTNFKVDGVRYYVSQVVAEKGSDNTSVGMFVGGVIGALGGGGGVAAGALIGAWLGKEQDKKEDAEVMEFNRSTV